MINHVNLVSLVLLASIVLSACGAGQISELTLTPNSTATSTLAPTSPSTQTLTPMDTPTPIPPTVTPISESIGEVETQQGIAMLTSVERATAWPQDCTGDSCFIVPNNGYELLIVNFVPKDSSTEEIDVELDANIYLSAESGQHYKLGSVGFISGGAQMVMFSVPVGASGFTLHWEDNPPIPLP